MKRTKVKEIILPLFTLQRSKRVLKSGVQTLKEDVETFMIPTLQKYGFDGKLVLAKEVDKKHAKKDYESYSPARTSARQLLYGAEAGWFLEIWKQGRPKTKLVVKPFVREDLKAIRNLPRYNLRTIVAQMLMTNAHPQARIKAILDKFYALDLTFLIMTKTGMFWLGKYRSIPFDQYDLTYRKDKKTLDRLRVKNGFQKGKIHSIKDCLVEELKKELYFFNKNNKYES
jgi:hypothetical protein